MVTEKTIETEETTERGIKMAKLSEFKKGNKIVEDGKVYIIDKVEVAKKGTGVETVLHYKPYFANISNSTITCSMPKNDLIASNVRQPATKQEIDDVLRYLTKTEAFNKIDVVEETKNFKLNSIQDTARVLKMGLFDQKLKGKNFDLTKNGIIKEAVNMMLEEIALVYDTTLEKAFSKIEQASKTYYSAAIV